MLPYPFTLSPATQSPAGSTSGNDSTSAAFQTRGVHSRATETSDDVTSPSDEDQGDDRSVAEPPESGPEEPPGSKRGVMSTIACPNSLL